MKLIPILRLELSVRSGKAANCVIAAKVGWFFNRLPLTFTLFSFQIYNIFDIQGLSERMLKVKCEQLQGVSKKR